MRRTGVLAVGILLLLSVAGCSAPAPAVKAGDGTLGPLVLAVRPAITATPEQRDGMAGQVLPIAAYRISPEVVLTVSRAERILTARCMARFGFPDPSAGLPEPTPDLNPLERRYGITDAVMAERWGYHTPPGWHGTVDEATRWNRPTRSPEELLVLTGSATGVPGPAGSTASPATRDGVPVPLDGCMGETRHQLTPGSDLGDPELVRRIDGSAQSDSDPLVVKALSAWSACMRTKGFDRTRPVKDPKQPKYTPQPTPEEVREAVADIGCKRETNLIGIWYAVEATYQNVMIQQNFQELDLIRKRNDETVRVATRVVSVE